MLRKDEDSLIFHISDWYSYDENDGEDEEVFNTVLFGRTEDDRDVCLLVKGFEPFFFVKIPHTWTNFHIERFITKIKEIVCYRCKYNPDNEVDLSKSLISHRIVKKYDFYGFTNKKLFNFIKLNFSSYSGMKAYANVLISPIKLTGSPKGETFDRYESNLEPHLRLMHMRDLKACNWIQVKKEHLIKLKYYSTCDITYSVEWKNINPYEYDKMVPFKIMGYDIECVSIKDFPQADRITDAIIQIGLTIYRFGSMKCEEQHMLVLGPCDEIDGVTVHCFPSERSLIKGFAKIISELRPDFIAGYNNFGFDDNYIYERANTLDKKSRELGNKYPFVLPELLKIGKLVDSRTVFETKKLSSSALGDNFLMFFKIPGIISIDMMKVIQKDHRLNGYRLDNVSANFIKESVIRIAKQSEKKNITIMKIYTKSTKALEDDAYIQIMVDDGYSPSPLREGAKYQVMEVGKETFEKDGKEQTLAIIIISIPTEDFAELNAVLANKLLKCFWTFAKDDMHYSLINEYFIDGNPKMIAQIAKYCLKDCKLVNLLMAKLEIIVNAIGMANVCHVPLSYLFLRGQGIKIFSLVSKKCAEKNYLIPHHKKSTTDDDEGYEGATVITPKPAVYEMPISVLDFSSLYPNSMRERNTSPECYLKEKKYDNLPGYIYHDTFIVLKDKKGRIIRDENGVAVKDHHRIAQKTISRDEIEKNMEDKFKKIRDKIEEDILKLENEIKNEEELEKKIQDKRKECEKLINKEIFKKYNIVGDQYVEYGILPEILSDLLNARSDTKERMKVVTDEFLLKVLDSLQNAQKVTANSLYGQTGAPTSPIYFVEIAACTTAIGRERLYSARDIVQQNFAGSEIIYGDSVTGDTPLTLLDENGDIFISTIKDLSDDWKKYDAFKAGESNRQNKEQAKCDNYVWTADGWAKIKRVIRHKTTKKIYRVLTHTGVVDVTEDHSLLDINGEKIKPKDCEIGTELLHGFMDFNNKYDKISLEEAYVWGFFMRDGSCEFYKCKIGDKYSWTLNNLDKSVLEKCKKYLEKTEEYSFKILDTINSSGVYELVVEKGVKYMTTKYRSIFYNSDKLKIVPKEILNSTIEIKKAFLQGYFAADGCKVDLENIGYRKFDIKGKIGTQCLFYLLKCIGFNVSLNTRSDNKDIYRLTFTEGEMRKTRNKIKKMHELYDTDIDSDEYVYDLETESGTFHAGIGELIVKNTDSIFINFHIRDKDGNDRTDKDALIMSIKKAQEAADAINQIVPKPQSIVYEKTFHPFILVTKKKYVGLLFEKDPNSYAVKSMGIVLKRRDNAPIVKIVVGGIIDCILKNRDINLAVDHTKKSLQKLIEGKYPMDKFIMSKTLKSNYKKPQQIAHKVLADRMALRDPGNKPQVNDRIAYVYFDTKMSKKKLKKCLQGDLIETPEFVIENNLEIDYLHYLTNQIITPAGQILELMMSAKEVKKMFSHYINQETNKRRGCETIDKWLVDNKHNDDNWEPILK